MVDACHIIDFKFLSKSSGIWSQKYNQYCYNINDGIFDVRNGILLSPSFHRAFGVFFTIIFEENEYKIKTGDTPILDLENGMILKFPTGTDSYGNEWKDQWPAPEFLKWHNDIFDAKQMKLKASADPILLKRQNTDETMHFHFDENDYRTKWLHEQSSTADYEDPELSIKAPQDSLEFTEQLQSL